MHHGLITFDLDGTLVDTAGEIAAAANLSLHELGIAPRPVAQITLLIGGGARHLMTTLLVQCVAEQPELAATLRDARQVEQAVERVMPLFEAHHAAVMGTLAAPYAGCHQALTMLRAAGVRLACVTNKDRLPALAVLKASGLDGFFELTIGGDTLPEKKPHASVLRHVAAVLGVDVSRMAHVGDSAIDVQAARHAGVGAWAVPYGYNAGRPIADAGPDHIFPGLIDVALFVLNGLQSTAGVTARTAPPAAATARSSR